MGAKIDHIEKFKHIRAFTNIKPFKFSIFLNSTKTDKEKHT